MASIWDNLVYGGHGVCESTLLHAVSAGSHFYNVMSETDDIDNGSVLKVPTPEKWVEDDYFKAEKAGVKDKIVLVNSVAKIYQEFNKLAQDEANFYNAAGEIMRAFEIFETDRFSLNEKAFDADADVEVGKYVVVKAGSYKLTTVDSIADESAYGFIGYIIKVNNSTNTYDIFVKKNQNA